jgi:O-antigen ligase
MLGLVPPFLLLLFGAWCGTFAGSASFAGSTVGAIALLGTLAAVGTPWRDPLRLGRAGRLLPPALWIAAALSAWRSPVPRASWVALLLLPAFLLLPGAVARCWSREEDRRLGLKAATILVAGVSLWALIDDAVRGLPRVAMPLGQHNLLASWLVILMPLALLTAREPGLWRWLGIASGFLPAVTILATLSLAGNLALAAEVLVALIWMVRSRRSWAWVLGLLLMVAALGLVSQRARIAGIVAGQDLSFRGRAVYYEGGLEGFRERPWLGWGPGSAAWTAAAFFDPVPGVSPWGEAVGELHSLPLHLAYELGAVGLLLALALGTVFLTRRASELRRSEDPALLFAGLAGLCGAAVAALGSAALAVTALPVATAVVAGAALSTRAEETPRSPRLPVLLYIAVAALGLAPVETARWSYEQAIPAAVAGRTGDAREALARAVRIDPSFPLYRTRLALIQGETARERAAAAELSLAAAQGARGVATLWTVAGILGFQAERPWTGEALETACALDPFNPFPPFYRMAFEPGAARAPRHGAHALLAEPRLAAATFWEAHPDLLARTVTELRSWPGVDAGWKEALIISLPPLAKRQGETALLELEIDTEPPLALSLHTFRRLPFPAQWPLLQVRRIPLERIQLPPATTLPGADFAVACPPQERSPVGQRVLNR